MNERVKKSRFELLWSDPAAVWFGLADSSARLSNKLPFSALFSSRSSPAGSVCWPRRQALLALCLQFWNFAQFKRNVSIHLNDRSHTHTHIQSGARNTIDCCSGYQPKRRTETNERNERTDELTKLRADRRQFVPRRFNNFTQSSPASLAVVVSYPCRLDMRRRKANLVCIRHSPVGGGERSGRI